MRAILLAAALAAVAGPASAGLGPDPMTVSGRFDLPRAAGPGRVALGKVELHPSVAEGAKAKPAAVEAAVRAAAERSLRNFGYLGEASPDVTLDLEALPVVVQPLADGALVEVRLVFRSTAEPACYARTAAGRFKVLERRRSGDGRRVFAVGSAVAMAFVGVDMSTFMTAQLEGASAENQSLNNLRPGTEAEGVAEGFGDKAVVAHGVTQATRLALADYIRQLGGAEACRPAAAS